MPGSSTGHFVCELLTPDSSGMIRSKKEEYMLETSTHVTSWGSFLWVRLGKVTESHHSDQRSIPNNSLSNVTKSKGASQWHLDQHQQLLFLVKDNYWGEIYKIPWPGLGGSSSCQELRVSTISSTSAKFICTTSPSMTLLEIFQFEKVKVQNLNHIKEVLHLYYVFYVLMPTENSWRHCDIIFPHQDMTTM